jgi:hypothetical protein
MVVPLRNPVTILVKVGFGFTVCNAGNALTTCTGSLCSVRGPTEKFDVLETGIGYIGGQGPFPNGMILSKKKSLDDSHAGSSIGPA